MTDQQVYEKRLQRERSARKHAERLLEEKSLELYEKNQSLEKSAKDLAAALSSLQAIMDSVPDIILTTSTDGTIVGANNAILRFLNLSPEDAIGRNLTEIAPDLTIQNLENSDDGDLFSREISIERRGREILFELTGTRTQIGDGERFTLVFRDMTRRKAAERAQRELQDQLGEARRLESLGTLASGVAHEINTPIQYIGDNVRFMVDSLIQINESYLRYEALANKVEEEGTYADLTEAIRNYNAEIDLAFLRDEVPKAATESVDGIEQVRTIVLAMRDFAHPGSNERVDVDINQVVQSALTVSHNSYKDMAKVITELDPSEPHVSCVSGQIQQVILNVLINAVQAIEETGRADGCIKVRTRKLEDFLQLTICDNGTGIPESIQRRIFDPFFTTKEVGRGTGQGLSLAQEIIVQGHGGRIYLGDEPDMKTALVIELPNDVPVETTKTLCAGEENAFAQA